jgi:hypothetical protein
MESDAGWTFMQMYALVGLTGCAFLLGLVLAGLWTQERIDAAEIRVMASEAREHRAKRQLQLALAEMEALTTGGALVEPELALDAFLQAAERRLEER